MTAWSHFLPAAFLLLVAPGPTNTLLAAGGAARGVRAAPTLPIAALAGYLIAVFVVSVLIGRQLVASPIAFAALKIGCSLYLSYVAWTLWREGAEALKTQVRVGLAEVFFATLMNPKAAVVGLSIMPAFDPARPGALAPYFAGFGGVVVASSLIWIGIGAAIARRAQSPAAARFVRRSAALTLGAFSVVLATSAFR
jgi:threonine/homoserine/homoserine lactone efflux protein